MNTLGQIIGDLLLMGLVAPLANRQRARRAGHPVRGWTLLDALARSTHRIQLLDVRLCLRNVATDPRDPSMSETTVGRDELMRALRAALSHDVCVEILLPDPDTPAGRHAAQDLGIDPNRYRQALGHLFDEIEALSAAVLCGRLDVRLYGEPAMASIVRCDARIWASLHPQGAPATAAYLALDQESENARTLRAYFENVRAVAHPRSPTCGEPSIRPARFRPGSGAGCAA